MNREEVAVGHFPRVPVFFTFEGEEIADMSNFVSRRIWNLYEPLVLTFMMKKWT